MTAPSTETNEEVIARLAALPPLEYESVRTEQAKAFGWRTTVLDSEVKKVQSVEAAEDANLPFPIVASHPEPIDPAQLLENIAHMIRKYIVLDPEQADAAALWVALTWFILHMDLAPLAIINAPEKACGKTQLLTVMGYMSNRPLPAANASSSAIFRAVEKWLPTMLIDEADTFFKDNPELQGMVNAGYLRGGYVLRSEACGDSFEPRMFSVFGPKAIAGIALEKHLPDATMSRGIVFNLRRKMPHESVSRLRHADRMLFGEITAKLARFAEDYAQRVKHTRPELPETLGDRDQDNWEPLLAIAGCAGEAWLKRATDAALKLSSSGENALSTGSQLLSDIKDYFMFVATDNKVCTVDLIAALEKEVESPWATYNRGKPITPRQLSKLLAAYGIHSKTVRIRGGTPKGFDEAQFKDAFARYLTPPSDLPPKGNCAPESNHSMGASVADDLPHETTKCNDASAASIANNPDVEDFIQIYFINLDCGATSGRLIYKYIEGATVCQL